MAKTNKNDMNFEEAMLKLEDIVISLENGDLKLDDSIRKFEEAVKLIRLCEEKLTTAKQKVKILTEGQDGTITDKPFVPSADDET